MHITIFGNSAAEKIKSHIESMWDNIEVSTYKSLDLFVTDCESRNIVCDRVIITEQALNNSDKVASLQLIKDYLDVHFMAIQTIVILRSDDILAACTDICYDTETSVVFCSATMKTNFLSALPVKTISELRSAYSMYMYQKTENTVEDVEDTTVGYADEAIEGYDDDDFGDYAENEAAGYNALEGDYDDIEVGGYSESDSEDYGDAGYGDDEDTEGCEDIDIGEYTGDDMLDYAESADGMSDEEYTDDTDDYADNMDYEGTLSETDDFSSVEIDDYLPDGDDTYAGMDVGTDVGFDVGDGDFADDFDDGLPTDYNIGDILQSYDETVETAENKAVADNSKPVSNGANKTGGLSGLRNKQAAKKAAPAAEPAPAAESAVAAETVTAKPNMQDKSIPVDNTAKRSKGFLKQKNKPSASVPMTGTSAVQPSIAPVAGTKYAQMMNGQTCGVIVVTGDRRAGATTFSLKVAEHFAQRTRTLFVDLDLVRRGSLFSLSIENLVRCGPAIQNGLGAVRVGGKVSSVAYKSPEYSFDALVSLPNFKLTDETIKQTQIQLLYQQEYNAVIIDCPFEHLHLISDILSTASVFICLSGDISSCAGTIFAMDALNPVNKTNETEKIGCLSEKDIAMVYRGRYVVTGNVTEDQVMRNMKYLEGIYGLSSESLNWAAMSIAGTKDRLDCVLQNLI